MSAVYYSAGLGLLALFFAFVAPADSHPARPLYPTRDHKTGVVFAVVAVVIAFCAGLSL